MSTQTDAVEAAMSDAKPARCPLCGSERTRIYPSMRGTRCIANCHSCGLTTIIRGGENNFREAWAKMGAWRDGGWRDIETAPHGERVLLGWWAPALWKKDQKWATTVAVATWTNETPGYPLSGKHASATHWMPLPEPPKEG